MKIWLVFREKRRLRKGLWRQEEPEIVDREVGIMHNERKRRQICAGERPCVFLLVKKEKEKNAS